MAQLQLFASLLPESGGAIKMVNVQQAEQYVAKRFFNYELALMEVHGKIARAYVRYWTINCLF